MARTLLALFLFCFVSLHAALPAAAATDEPDKTVSLLAGEMADSEDEGDPRGSSDSATKCHDGCSWLADWHLPVLREALRSPQNGRSRTIPPGLVALVAPPPK
ncbi:MAG: hypothetical protein JNL61_12445 [Rhizobiaceae bacterium]|nr:hypothetical protein [Rhizobiaceae bacterium]